MQAEQLSPGASNHTAWLHCLPRQQSIVTWRIPQPSMRTYLMVEEFYLLGYNAVH
jgi:hypothetical protein